MAQRCGKVSERRTERDARRVVNEAIDGIAAAFEFEAEHVAEAAIQHARGNRVIGVIVARWIPDANDATSLREPIGEMCGVLARGPHAQLQRRQAALREPAIERIGREPPYA